MIDGIEKTYGTSNPDECFSKNFVLDFARLRLSHVNNNLNHQLTIMKQGQADTAAINDILAWCAEHKDGTTTNDDRKALVERIHAAAAKLPEGATKQYLLGLADKGDSLINQGGEERVGGTGNGSGDKIITAGEVAAVESQLKNMGSRIDGACKECELRVNVLMGDQQAITGLSANLIQMLNQSTMSIVGAMR